MPLPPLRPFWETTDRKSVRLYCGDVLEVLRKMPAQSVHCVVTSPPYWGLRDYQTAKWTGGDPGCNHRKLIIPRQDKEHGKMHRISAAAHAERDMPYVSHCGRCGARCFDAQLGSEAQPDCLRWARGENCAEQDWPNACYVCRMVLVCREIWRVLRDDGVFWLNIGDTYSGGGRGSKGGQGATSPLQLSNHGTSVRTRKRMPLPSGNLVGVPWSVAFALRADGWVLRQDNIWHKPGPMPESVKTRCSKAHEYVFQLVKKGSGYFFDYMAIQTDAEPAERVTGGKSGKDKKTGSLAQAGAAGTKPSGNGVLGAVMRTGNRANKRSVWTVGSPGYKGAHFATFPPKLVEPMILASTSEHGCCDLCKAPWRRVVERKRLPTRPARESKTYEDGDGDVRKSSDETGNRDPARHCTVVRTVGWEPTCSCRGKQVAYKVKLKGQVVSQGKERWVTRYRYESDLPLEEHPTVPGVVLDPFVGSGTALMVAVLQGRRGVGIDLSEKYLSKYAVRRVEGALRRARRSHIIPGEGPEKIA
jgi:site-specific DNA-methyltransferase (cytosine-N4-specific)